MAMGAQADGGRHITVWAWGHIAAEDAARIILRRWEGRSHIAIRDARVAAVLGIYNILALCRIGVSAPKMRFGKTEPLKAERAK